MYFQSNLMFNFHLFFNSAPPAAETITFLAEPIKENCVAGMNIVYAAVQFTQVSFIMIL